MGEESPQQRIARLQRELADAKVQALQAELAEAQGSASAVPTATEGPSSWPWATKIEHVEADRGVLAPAPRRVPFAFKALVLPWSWWTLFTLFMVSIAPLGLWITVPAAAAIAAGVTLVVIVTVRVVRERTQLALLKWGEVVTVTDSDVKNVGTYYSGTTYQNVRLPQAHGWKVTRDWYSGPGTTTKIGYQLNGTTGTLTMHGLGYDDGVILADQRDPQRALCVSSFAYALDRDSSGNWIGQVGGRVLVGSMIMIAVLLGWTAVMVIGSGVLA